MQYADLEPLIDDGRLARIEGTLRAELPVPDDFEFVTFVLPGGMREGASGIVSRQEEKAAFAVLAPHPKHPETKIMTQGTLPLRQFRDMERTRSHFVGVDDAPLVFFRRITKAHIAKMRSAKDLI